IQSPIFVQHVTNVNNIQRYFNRVFALANHYIEILDCFEVNTFKVWEYNAVSLNKLAAMAAQVFILLNKAIKLLPFLVSRTRVGSEVFYKLNITLAFRNIHQVVRSTVVVRVTA